MLYRSLHSLHQPLHLLCVELRALDIFIAFACRAQDRTLEFWEQSGAQISGARQRLLHCPL